MVASCVNNQRKDSSRLDWNACQVRQSVKQRAGGGGGGGRASAVCMWGLVHKPGLLGPWFWHHNMGSCGAILKFVCMQPDAKDRFMECKNAYQQLLEEKERGSQGPWGKAGATSGWAGWGSSSGSSSSGAGGRQSYRASSGTGSRPPPQQEESYGFGECLQNATSSIAHFRVVGCLLMCLSPDVLFCASPAQPRLVHKHSNCGTGAPGLQWNPLCLTRTAVLASGDLVDFAFGLGQGARKKFNKAVETVGGLADGSWSRLAHMVLYILPARVHARLNRRSLPLTRIPGAMPQAYNSWKSASTRSHLFTTSGPA